MSGPRTDEPLVARAKLTALAPPEAWARLAERCAALPAEDVPIGEAAGRVLAETVRSAVALPRDTNSAMDGFAVRAGEGPHEGALIVGESRAGAPFTGEIPPGAVIRIATGGALPPGLDAAVKIEDATFAEPAACAAPTAAAAPATSTTPDASAGGRPSRVSLPAVPVGNNIRVAGEDLAIGDEIVGAGTRLAAHHLVGLAGAGHPTVLCHRRPVVTLVVTGDEIVPLGAPVAPGQVTDVHGIALPALIRGAGGVLGQILHAPDRRADVIALLEGLESCDVVLVTGGLSVGEHDHTRPALAALGVQLFVERLLLRPGQPTAIGQRDDPRQLWFGLPGNPVSAFAIAALFLAPTLRLLGGAPDGAFAGQPARLTAPITPDATRWLALRGIRHGDDLELLRGQESHMVSALAAADALALLPPSDVPLAAGELVDAIDLQAIVSAWAIT